MARVANAGNVSKKEKKKKKSVSEQVLRDATSTTTLKMKTKPKTIKKTSINSKKRKAEKYNDKKLKKTKKKKKKKKILLAPRPITTTATTTTSLLLPANHLAHLISSVPALRLRLRALEFMFWSQLFPLLATQGWEYVSATSCAAEVFVPGKNKKVRLRSIFETLCYLSSPGGVSSHQMVCHLVRSLLEQRRLIACVSMTVQQQQQKGMQKKEEEKEEKKEKPGGDMYRKPFGGRAKGDGEEMEEEEKEEKERVRRERVQQSLQQQRSTVEVTPSNGKKELSSSCSPLGSMKLMRMGNL